MPQDGQTGMADVISAIDDTEGLASSGGASCDPGANEKPQVPQNASPGSMSIPQLGQDNAVDVAAAEAAAGAGRGVGADATGAAISMTSGSSYSFIEWPQVLQTSSSAVKSIPQLGHVRMAENGATIVLLC